MKEQILDNCTVYQTSQFFFVAVYQQLNSSQIACVVIIKLFACVELSLILPVFRRFKEV